MKVIVFVLAAVALCGATTHDGPQCEAPNGGGLVPMLNEFIAMIPFDSVFEILLIAITSDRETQDVLEFLFSNEFHAILTTINDTTAFNSLLTFACNDLYIDAQYYINIVLGFLGLPELGPRATRAGGFNAMLEEILALIPLDKAQALLEEKLATDYYVQLAVQKINSDEFKTLVGGLQADAAWNDLMIRLSGIGVDVDRILSAIGKIIRP